MNKFYSLLFAFAAATFASAQNIYVLNPSLQEAQSPTTQLSVAQSAHPAAAFKAPAARAQQYENFTLEDGQYIVGNSSDDAYDQFGQAPYPGEILVGSVIYSSSYKDLKNCKALGIRFCLPHEEDWGVETEVKSVTLFDSEIEPMKEQKLSSPAQYGWNYVPFDTPMELDPEGTFIGYTYIQKENNCGICNWPFSASGGFYVYLYNTDQKKWTWGNFSAYYGAVCIQLIVEAEIADYEVTPIEAESVPTAVGSQATTTVYLQSDSRYQVDNIDYTITIDGKAYDTHREFADPVPSGINQVFGLEVAYPVPDAPGTYPVTFAVTKVNGNDVEETAPISFKQSVYTRVAKRRTVIEEYTGTGCGYCPRGWVGMEYMKNNYPEDFIGIAVHQYNQNDPMYCARYAKLAFGGAPTCLIDRKSGATDPYFGSGYGIFNDFLRYQSIAPAVDVTVTGTFTEDLKKVVCDAEVEFLTNTEKYTIAYVLTADNLRGKNSSWLQTNYYSNQNAGDANVMAEMPDLAEFCSGGKYAKTSLVTFNDVLIGASYSTSGSNYAKALGASRHTAGEVVTNTYNCAMPTSKTILDVLDYDNVYVNALVVDTEGFIANAARAKVQLPEGIGTVIADSNDDSAVFYDLNGRASSTPAKGINITSGKKILF